MLEAILELRAVTIGVATKKRVGGALAVLAIVAYFQSFDFGYQHLLHRSEQFHYFVGAKYLRELGYERLYVCTTVAEAELGGLAEIEKRSLRDLHVNALVPARAAAIAASEACHAAFTPARWQALREDVRVFRKLAGVEYWQTIQADHGFNGTPAWAVLGGSLAGLSSASLPFLRGLAWIDLVLMASSALLLAWAFGWRVACLAVVFWGTQAASILYWTGGAFLRQDGIACLVATACLSRRGRPLLAGLCLGYAVAVRLYPVFLLGGLVVAAAGAWRRRGSLPTPWRRLFAGVVIASSVLFGASVVRSGFAAWPAFVAHIRMHDATPTTNRMGWKAVVGHHAEGRAEVVEDPRAFDPYARWKTLRAARLERLRPVVVGGMLVAALLLAWTVSRVRAPWISLGIGVLSLTVHVGLTCYYHAFLVLAAPLSRARRAVELALLTTAVLGNIIVLRFAAFDDRYALLSLLHIVFATFVTLLFARPVSTAR